MGLWIACGFLDILVELRTCTQYHVAPKPETFTLCFFAEKACQPLLQLNAIPADLELGVGGLWRRVRYIRYVNKITLVLGRRKGGISALEEIEGVHYTRASPLTSLRLHFAFCG